MLMARFQDGSDRLIGVVAGSQVRPLARQPEASLAERLGVAAVGASGWLEGDPLPLGSPRPLDEVRLLAPVPHPDKIICVGVNYRLHADESSMAPPQHPEVFAKFPAAISDPMAPIVLPDQDAAIDYEGELVAVVGRRARHLTPGEALSALAGYTLANDVSARTVQLRVSQWTSGKTLDTFCPLGPWLATPGSIPDPQALRLSTTIGGKTLQDASTGEMIFGVVDLLVYLSSLMTLEPGDLLLTGTPAGVGHARSPRRYLVEGDVVEIRADGIGTLRNPVVRVVRDPAQASTGVTADPAAAG